MKMYMEDMELLNAPSVLSSTCRYLYINLFKYMFILVFLYVHLFIFTYTNMHVHILMES